MLLLIGILLLAVVVIQSLLCVVDLLGNVIGLVEVIVNGRRSRMDVDRRLLIQMIDRIDDLRTAAYGYDIPANDYYVSPLLGRVLECRKNLKKIKIRLNSPSHSKT